MMPGAQSRRRLQEKEIRMGGSRLNARMFLGSSWLVQLLLPFETTSCPYEGYREAVLYQMPPQTRTQAAAILASPLQLHPKHCHQQLHFVRVPSAKGS